MLLTYSRMTPIKNVFLVLMIFLFSSPDRGDVEVSCVFMESCILPCEFEAGEGTIMHWIQLTAGNAPVHSYFYNQDQFFHQNPRFTDRTKLFMDQISRGNASLQLTGVQVQDQGRYKCSTSTTGGNKESFINLKVDAQVLKVDIQQRQNNITCKSDRIYPKPKLNWSTSPQSNVTLNNTTEVLQTGQQLFNIISSLIDSDSSGDLKYICNISTQSSSRTASLKILPPISGSVTKTTIPCPPSITSPTRLVWRFNQGQTILIRTGAKVIYAEKWRLQVKDVSESGDLTLQDLSSSQEGIYTCERSNNEETYITSTFLRMDNNLSTKVKGIAGGVLGAIFLVVLIVLVGRWAKNQREARDQQIPEPPDGVSDSDRLRSRGAPPLQRRLRSHSAPPLHRSFRSQGAPPLQWSLRSLSAV